MTSPYFMMLIMPQNNVLTDVDLLSDRFSLITINDMELEDKYIFHLTTSHNIGNTEKVCWKWMRFPVSIAQPVASWISSIRCKYTLVHFNFQFKKPLIFIIHNEKHSFWRMIPSIESMVVCILMDSSFPCCQILQCLSIFFFFSSFTTVNHGLWHIIFFSSSCQPGAVVQFLKRQQAVLVKCHCDDAFPLLRVKVWSLIEKSLSCDYNENSPQWCCHENRQYC